MDSWISARDGQVHTSPLLKGVVESSILSCSTTPTPANTGVFEDPAHGSVRYLARNGRERTPNVGFIIRQISASGSRIVLGHSVMTDHVKAAHSLEAAI